MTKINFKNNKTKTITATATVLIILLMAGPTIQPSIGMQQVSSTCTSSVNKQTQTELNSINTEEAQSLAIQNEDFKSKTMGHGTSFNSIFVEGSYTSDCAVTWKDVNVVYDLKDSKGQYVTHIVVREDPTLKIVLGTSEQKGGTFSATADNANWSGYEFYYPQSMSANYSVWETTSSWQVPSISQPASGKCVSIECDAAVWNGLEDEQGANPDNHLAQGGSDSNMTCTSGTNCNSPLYSVWYEFLGSSPHAIYCNNISVFSGDTIESDILDTTQNPSASSSQYDVSIQDTTTAPGTVCGATGYSYGLNNPTLADYILERTKINSSYADLADFASTTMSGQMYYNSQYNNIQSSYNNGDYRTDIMYNTTPNTSVGSVSSNQFTQSWITSTGT
jgi:hypothetical protein